MIDLSGRLVGSSDVFSIVGDRKPTSLWLPSEGIFLVDRIFFPHLTNIFDDILVCV